MSSIRVILLPRESPETSKLNADWDNARVHLHIQLQTHKHTHITCALAHIHTYTYTHAHSRDIGSVIRPRVTYARIPNATMSSIIYRRVLYVMPK